MPGIQLSIRECDNLLVSLKPKFLLHGLSRGYLFVRYFNSLNLKVMQLMFDSVCDRSDI